MKCVMKRIKTLTLSLKMLINLKKKTSSTVLLQKLSQPLPQRCIKQICRPSGRKSPKLFFAGSSVPLTVGFCTAVNSRLVVLNNTDLRYLIGQHPCAEERQDCSYSRNLLQEQAQPHRGNALSVLTGNVSAAGRPALNFSQMDYCSKK